MLRILHASDFHLDYPFPLAEEHVDGRRQDQLKTFERVVNLAIKSEVDLLVVAGNLFASPRPQRTIVEVVRSQLNRLAERGIVPVILPGSRDGILTPDNVYRLVSFPGVLLADLGQLRRPVSIDTSRTTVHLYGFVWGSAGGDSGSLVSLTRRQQPGYHVGVLQASSQGEEDAAWFHPLPAVDAETIREWNLDYVALGNRRNWKVLPDEDRPLAAFSGTPEGLDFGESGPRYCALVSLADGATQVEPLTVNSCRLHHEEIDLSDCSDRASLAARIAEMAHPDLILRVRLIGVADCPVDAASLQNELKERFSHLEIEDRSQTLVGAFGDMLRGEDGPVAALVEHARQLFGDATSDDDRMHVERAFRVALSHLRAQAGGDL